MREYTMQDAIKAYHERIEKELQIGVRIWVEIDGHKVPATKQDVIDAIKAYKTVKRI